MNQYTYSVLGQFAILVKIGRVNHCSYYTHQTREIYQRLPYSVDFTEGGGLWNPLSKKLLSKCSFNWNKEPVNILNDRKDQQ